MCVYVYVCMYMCMRTAESPRHRIRGCSPHGIIVANLVYTGGYPAKIRLGWRLAYDVDCSRKSRQWMVRRNEDLDF